MNLLILKNDEPRDGPPRFDDCPHFSSLSLPLHRKMPVAIPKQYARAKSATPSENVSESIFLQMLNSDDEWILFTENVER